MKTWTKQEYYDDIVRRVKENLLPAVTDYDTCRYRLDMTADCPRRCLVGILLPDADYDRDLESLSVRAAQVKSRIDQVEGITLGDLANLQVLHDRQAKQGWNKKVFLELLNDLPCMADVQQIEPEEVLS